MEKIISHPRKVKVHGNIISNEHGFITNMNDFESKQCQIEKTEGDEFYGFNVYGIRLIKDIELVNHFSKGMQYCTLDNINNIYLCDHLETGESIEDIIYNPIIGFTDVFDINGYNAGYTFVVNNDYLNNSIDEDSPFFLLLHDYNTGVPVPNGANTVNYSFNFIASQDMGIVEAGFIFIDNNNKLISTSERIELINSSVSGGIQRQQIVSEIPNGTKYISIEFYIPKGIIEGQYIHLDKNCLLFDRDYQLFVRNSVSNEEEE